jgi:mono/diheme cytochrome c family protein
MPRFFTFRAWVIVVALALTPLGGDSPAQAQEPAAVAASTNPTGAEFFEKKVRPLLAARCHECHGPQKQKGNLRLDSRFAVLKGGDTAPAVVPGKPDESLLVDAIRYGEIYQMPPKSQLPPQEIANLVEWVRIGAPWGRDVAPSSDGVQGAAVFDLQARLSHWSFQPLASAPPPEVAGIDWVKTPVDRFILAGLEAAGISPAPAADKPALIRRVTYDLIGLPPTPAQIDVFLCDQSPSAYESLVDSLLASPHYGERWARHWLDLVRYAETYGHEFDYDMPNAFRYRDYVIRALNADVPYDQFAIEHVAGDLLPAPRRHPQEGFNESIIGTGCFFFGEAKHSPVDVRADEAERIDNQIDVLAKTFLGLTVSCARCHDHKFDAISTRDYYALAGYLQSSRYQQAFIDPPQALEKSIAELNHLHAERRQTAMRYAQVVLAPRLTRLADAMLSPGESPSAEAWAKHLNGQALTRVDDVFHPWAVLMQKQPEEATDDFSARRAKLAAALAAELDHDSAGGLFVFADFKSADYAPWRATGAAFGEVPGGADTWTSGKPLGRLLGAAAAHSGLVSNKLQGTLRSPTFEITKPRVWHRLYGTGGQLRLIVDGLQLIQEPIYGGLKIAPGRSEPHWHEQDVSKWIGHRAYIETIDDGDGYLALEAVAFSDGPAPAIKPNRFVAQLVADPSVTSPQRLAERYQALFQQVFAAWQADRDHGPQLDADRSAIMTSILEQQLPGAPSSDTEQAAIVASMAALERRQLEIESSIAPPRQAMALADGTAENEHVFIRGSHKNLGDEVPRRFLEGLGGARHAPPEQGSGRLELARQIASPANPLFARVMVNRLWQHHFGAGLVRSPDDFGVMGQGPTHPELLDYLAAEFVRARWSLKQMHRLMVLSSAYRMSSHPDAAADLADADNKLWHRMSVRRLEAECVRDAILAVSGAADCKMYGPGVMPYLTASMTGRGRPAASGPLDGDARRSIYLAVRRNFLSPMFLAFDYPTPFTTIGRRGASNVPAQALAMMNNPFVLEQARLWGARVASEPNRATADRVREMYRTALGRSPDEFEERAALSFLGEAEPGAIAVDLQNWAELAHVLFNLKEFIFIP